MKKVIAMLLASVLLCGCCAESDLSSALNLRSKLQEHRVSFDVDISADYGEEIYTFSLSCQTEEGGDLRFCVKQPESIVGIEGVVREKTGELIFDDQVLAFPTLADGYITPVGAPWVLLRGLRSGYLKSASKEQGNLRCAIDDTYAEDAVHIDVWLSAEDVPVRADLLYKGRRYITLNVTNFRFL